MCYWFNLYLGNYCSGINMVGTFVFAGAQNVSPDDQNAHTLLHERAGNISAVQKLSYERAQHLLSKQNFCTVCV